MARSARNEPKKEQSEPARPVVQDERLAKRGSIEGNHNIPVRTLVYLELGDLPAVEARQALVAVREMHGKSAHPTFILPLRDGKLRTDMLFENEILDFVGKVCEVKDGAIVMKGGYTDVDIMRTSL